MSDTNTPPLPENPSEFKEFRCSMCQQIGGDTQLGAYDGCPKNGNKKHDTNGGVV